MFITNTGLSIQARHYVRLTVALLIYEKPVMNEVKKYRHETSKQRVVALNSDIHGDHVMKRVCPANRYALPLQVLTPQNN